MQLLGTRGRFARAGEIEDKTSKRGLMGQGGTEVGSSIGYGMCQLSRISLNGVGLKGQGQKNAGRTSSWSDKFDRGLTSLNGAG